MNNKPPKPRKCRCGCGEYFTPRKSMQVAATPECAQRIAESKREKAERAAKKVERQETRAARERLKSRSDHTRDAQDAFNAFIRARDHDKPCISCGTTNPPMTAGGQWDAGHFKSRGAYPELRFNEDNCHKQCKVCNGGGGRFAHKERTVSEQYERNLVLRIGQARVDVLNGPHEPKKYTVDDLKKIKADYRALLRDLKKVLS